MPLTAIIALNYDCSALAYNQLTFWNFCRIDLAIVRKTAPNPTLPETAHQSGEGSLITIPTLPVNELTGIATISLPYPKFVFFERK
jgi:hypothetical protein